MHSLPTLYSLAPSAHPAYGSERSLWAPAAGRSPNKENKIAVHFVPFVAVRTHNFIIKPGKIDWLVLWCSAECTDFTLRLNWPARAARPSEPNTWLGLWPRSSTAGGPHSAFPGSVNDTHEGFCFSNYHSLMRGSFGDRATYGYLLQSYRPGPWAPSAEPGSSG